MAWSRGSSLFEEITSIIRANVSDYADRVDIYRELIPLFEDYDAELSDVYGSVDEAFDEAWREAYPEQDEEDYEEEE